MKTLEIKKWVVAGICIGLLAIFTVPVVGMADEIVSISGANMEILKYGAANPGWPWTFVNIGPLGFAIRDVGVNDGVATGDVDGDGLDEMVVTSGPGVAILKYGAPNPGWPWVFSNIGPIAFAIRDVGVNDGVATGDVDGDGKDEIILTSGPGVAILKYGAPNPGWPWTFVGMGPIAFAVGDAGAGGMVGVATGDVDNDGKDEVVVITGNSGVVVMKYGAPNPGWPWTFVGVGPVALAVADAGAGGMVGVATGDVDNDGKDEVVVITGNSGVVVMKYGAPNPGWPWTFVGVGPVALAVADAGALGILDVATGDVDGGSDEVVIITGSSGVVVMEYGAPNPGWPWTFSNIGPIAFAIRDVGVNDGVATSDVDSDGKDEVILTSGAGVAILKYGAPNPGWPWTFSNIGPLGFAIRDVGVFGGVATGSVFPDCDNDGIEDALDTPAILSCSIKPERMNNTGAGNNAIMTAFVWLDCNADVATATITGVTINGTPAEKVMTDDTENKVIIKVRRKDVIHSDSYTVNLVVDGVALTCSN